MATTISRNAGNVLRSDAQNRDEIRAAAHLLASLLPPDDDVDSYVLDFERDDDGALVGLGVYAHEDWAELHEEEEEMYEEEGEDD